MERWVTRRTIIERAKDPDDDLAWEEFVKYYEGYIHIVLRKILFDYSDLHDITQEILLKIWKQLQKFDIDSDRAQFRRWLTVLIRNQALTYITSDKRYKNRKDMAVQEYSMESPAKSSELDEVIQKEWKLHITKTALQNIKPQFKGNAVEAFELYLGGKTTREISEELDINQNSVLILVNRVKLKLANEVARLQEMLEF